MEHDMSDPLQEHIERCIKAARLELLRDGEDPDDPRWVEVERLLRAAPRLLEACKIAYHNPCDPGPEADLDPANDLAVNAIQRAIRLVCKLGDVWDPGKETETTDRVRECEVCGLYFDGHETWRFRPEAWERPNCFPVGTCPRCMAIYQQPTPKGT